MNQHVMSCHMSMCHCTRDKKQIYADYIFKRFGMDVWLDIILVTYTHILELIVNR